MITNKEFPSERNYEKSNVMAEKKPLPSDIPSSLVLQIKSVFKCRLCPRVICLTEDTLRNHLQSKVLHFFLWFLNAYASIFTISATIVWEESHNLLNILHQKINYCIFHIHFLDIQYLVWTGKFYVNASVTCLTIYARLEFSTI